jgi:deazaflavin-dependent oxidoreductase (nitroreductase family)
MKPEPSLAELVANDSRARGPGRLLGRALDHPRVGRTLSRLARAPNRIPLVRTLVTPCHAWLLRVSGGRLRRSWLFAAGQPVLSLTTIGRRTGVPRSTAVAAFTYEGRLALAGMNLGRDRNPAWAFNLEAHPEATIELRGRKIAVEARRVHGEEAARMWRRWIEVQPSATAFRELAGREIPIFALTPRT